ncbi:TPA: hypothetical protein DIV55_05230 [Patescibacteria group bacterium]|uniref:Methyltransferase FkbM family n=1 Tax=Candidatus Gottesmanbacteria bacterium GW2011_GWA1_43_11 TaxID=1618436 RepID=A0A0G1FHL2_9BACT|nr:MAG: Methyltransferase FkbM family [Candidatus Gottesmanbacteria bacterium GW2011_GWA1_43_11]HCS79112.1 hypothetical protein [Patescibacteria group bacterium]
MKPYLSIIVTGRNDDYGLRFKYRLKLFFKSLLNQLDNWSISAEIIVVEWNPPRARENISSVLKKWFAFTPVPIRVIEVSPRQHRNFVNSDRIPLFEYIAKNTGVRRAKGEYILVTNPDILFPGKLIQFIANRQLEKNTFYRIDRIDYKLPSGFNSANITEQFKLAKRFAFSLHTLGCGIRLRTSLPFPIRMQLGYINAVLMRRLIRKQGKLIDRVHANVAGDFMLMHRTQWNKLRGFPEKPTNTYMDCYLCFSVAAIGLRQYIFPSSFSLFHLEHTRPTTKRPKISVSQLVNDYRQILNHDQSPILNNSNWGLSSQKLHEVRIAK